MLNGFNKDFNGFFPIRGIESECEFLSAIRNSEDPSYKWIDVKDRSDRETVTGYLHCNHTPKLDFYKAEVTYTSINDLPAENHINLTLEQMGTAD